MGMLRSRSVFGTAARVSHVSVAPVAVPFGADKGLTNVAHRAVYQTPAGC